MQPYIVCTHYIVCKVEEHLAQFLMELCNYYEGLCGSIMPRSPFLSVNLMINELLVDEICLKSQAWIGILLNLILLFLHLFLYFLLIMGIMQMLDFMTTVFVNKRVIEKFNILSWIEHHININKSIESSLHSLETNKNHVHIALHNLT